MARTFKHTSGALKFHVKNANDSAKKAIVEIKNQWLRDLDNGLVPEWTGRLKQSGHENSKVRGKKAFIIHKTPYARRRYFDNKSGVIFWNLVNFARNKNKYKRIIINRLRRK